MYETKVHYKLYKAGTKWLAAAIGVTALGIGLTQTTLAQASTTDDNSSAGDDVAKVSGNSASSETNTQKLRTAVAEDDSLSDGANNDSSNNDSSNDSNNDAGSTQGTSGSGQDTDTKGDQGSTVTNQGNDTDKTTDTAFTETDNTYNPGTTEIQTKVTVSATNDEGTQTSKNSDYSPALKPSTDLKKVNVTYNLQNTTAKQQGEQIKLNLAQDNTAVTLDNSVTEDVFTTGLPAGTQLTYTATVNGLTYTASSYADMMSKAPDFTWSDLTNVLYYNVPGIAANADYTIVLPFNIATGATGSATFGYQNVWGKESKGVTLNFPSRQDTVPVATPQTPHTTVDPATATSTAPAIINDPDKTDIATTDDLAASVRLVATNDQGTAVSWSSYHKNLNANQNLTSVINSNATDLKAIFNFANNTNNAISNVDLIFTLPGYWDNSSSVNVPVQLTMDSHFTLADLMSQLPSGITATFYDNTLDLSDVSYQTLLDADPNFDMSKVTEIRLRGTLSANTSISVVAPLVETDNVDLDTMNPEYFDVYNYSKGDWLEALTRVAVRIASVKPAISGKYDAVVTDTDNDGYTYDQVPSEIEDLMPQVTKGDLSYHNFGYLFGNTSDNLTTGGSIILNLVHTGITDLVKDKGYSVLLQSTDADAQPAQLLLYDISSKDPAAHIKGNEASPTADATDDPAMAKTVMIQLRRVVAAKDSTIKQGDSWDKADNFVSALDNANHDLTVNDVMVMVNDPNGIIQNGRAVKGGTFTVTYAYQVASDYNNTGKPYIVSDTATVTVTPSPVVDNGGSTMTTPTTGTTTTGKTAIVAGGSGDKPVTKAVKKTAKKGNKKSTSKLVSGRQNARGTKSTGYVSGGQAVVGHARVATLAAKATDHTTTLTANAKTSLPQTSDRHQDGVVALGLSLLMGALGLAGADRRKRQD